MYPYPNSNGGIVEVWEWISNVVPNVIVDVITYPLIHARIKVKPC